MGNCKSPKYFETILRGSVMGQDEGIRTVAIAISSHLARISHNRNNPSAPIRKDNLLILGPTGCGKTESFRTVIRACNLPIPVAIISTGSLTADGYKGKNVGSILYDLVRDALRIINKNPSVYIKKTEDEDERKKMIKKAIVSLANNGIIILDEFDKIRIDPLKDEQDNFFPKAAQRQLLGMIEGATGLGADEPESLIDTTDILFVATGAFVGLDEIIRERLKPKSGVSRRIGFVPGEDETAGIEPQTTELKTACLLPNTEDFIAYGFISELIGRIPLRCRYNELSEDTLCRILNDSAISPVKDFQRLFKTNGNMLAFTGDALRDIAVRAFAMHTGARALRSVIADVAYPVYYDLSDKTGMQVLITSETVTSCQAPVVTAYSGTGGDSSYRKADSWTTHRDAAARIDRQERAVPVQRPGEPEMPVPKHP